MRHSARTAWELVTVVREWSATSGMVRASGQSATRGGMDPLARQVSSLIDWLIGWLAD